jgi:mRNA-degrading endonuclease RelE of RelBE toxin-antitoxin system
MPLAVVLSAEAQKQFRSFPKRIQHQIKSKIELLASNPSAGDTKPLHGSLRQYSRLRSGDYRIWFHVAGSTLYVIKVTNRKDGYD